MPAQKTHGDFGDALKKVQAPRIPSPGRPFVEAMAFLEEGSESNS